MLDELRRMQSSYMEMAIKDDDLRVLKMVYTLHKGGISKEHPRFGFRRPMRMAAACGRLEMLKWLEELEERDEWLQDPWLLDDAIKSCRLDVAQWVHLSYREEAAGTVTTKSLHKAASEGAIELLQWALTTFPDAQLTTDAMDGAAANGHLETDQYLHSERNEGCTTAAMDKAAGNGHLAVVEYLHTHRQEGCTVRAMNNAAGNGHLHVIKFLAGNREEGCTDKAMKEAAAGGHLDVIRYLPESRSADFTEEAMDRAIRNGHLDFAKCLYEQQCHDGDYVISVRSALGWRYLSLVRFACEHFHTNLSAAELEGGSSEDVLETIHVFEQFNVDGWTPKVMDHAADIGNLEAVRYLHSHRTEGCTTKAMDNAASNGHLEVVKFLHENRSEGCTKLAMNGAAEKGALDVVKYLHEHRSEACTGVAFERAALNGHIDVVRFLLDHCDVSVPPNTALCAARGGHWELLRVLLQVQFPKSLTRIVSEFAYGGHVAHLKRVLDLEEGSESTLRMCLTEAVGNGHWYVVKFLLGELRRIESPSYTNGSYWFSGLVQTAAMYGDIDTVELLLSIKRRFVPRQAHGFINSTILGSFELLEMLENARKKQNRWDEEPSDRMDDEFFEYTGLDWRFVQMAVAGAYGHIKILTSLSDLHGGSLQPKIAVYYAASNQIDAIHCLYKMYSFFAVRGSAIVAAARHGHLSVLKYLHKKRQRRPCKVPLLDIAAEGGSLDAVKFIHEHCPIGRCTTEAMDAAAQNGHLDIVRFLHQQRSEGCTVKAMDEASDEFTVLRFLHTHRREGCTTAAMDAATIRGNLKVVKFLHENRKEGCTTNAMDHAAMNGYLSTIRYLHEHRTEGCSKRAMRLAIEIGNFLVVKFLHQFRTEGCTAAALDTAVLCGHLTIARFLSENRTEGCTKHGFDWAIRSGDLDMVRFLHENRHEGYHEAVLEKAIARDPEDTYLVQQFLRPNELKDTVSRRRFLERLKFERVFKEGRFAPKRRAEQAEDAYDSANESEEWGAELE